MPRTFADVRVSTMGQTTENQIQEIKAAGFHVEPHRIVTKLDRLGRDAIDVSATVKALTKIGVRVYCLALGEVELTSSSGTITMQVLNAVVQFERDLLIERTQSGLKRATAKGKTLGRPSMLNEKQKKEVRAELAKGVSVSSIARNFATSRQTIMRVRN